MADAEPTEGLSPAGYSQVPHLHVAVFRAVEGTEREIVPVRFRCRERGGGGGGWGRHAHGAVNGVGAADVPRAPERLVFHDQA